MKRKLPESPAFEQGNLNKVYFGRDAGGKKYVLRLFRADRRVAIKDYLGSLYKKMGFNKYGARLRYRNVAEQVSRMKTLAAKDIPVPGVRAHGKEWMLMDFVEGKPLKELLPTLKGRAAKLPIRATLSALMDVHAQDECLWDRWGANEMVDAKGAVCFIDFDINIRWPKPVPHKIKASFDLAVLLRGCVQFSPDKRLAREIVAEILRGNKKLKETYNLEVLRRFLAGQIAFYDAQYCRNAQASPMDKTTHQATNKEMGKIRQCISRLS